MLIRRGAQTTRPLLAASLVLGAALLAGCGSAAGDSVTLQLRTLNGSGVTGSVRLTPLSDGRTQVDVDVDPADHPNMPAHIHPGTCDELVPQPKYPLTNVVGGKSSTEVAVSLDELRSDTVALNLHASNTDMQTYTACIELTAP